MSRALTPLVDLDGTLVRLELDWERAREEAARHGLPRRLGEALTNDVDGGFREWFDAFECGATVVPLHPRLHDYLRQRTWALVTNNGRPLVARVVDEGYVPAPDVVVARGALPLKPAPDTLLAAVAALARVSEPRPLYIGDSDVDRRAAEAASMPFLPVAAVVA